MIYPVILSGGSGTRLWPVSRQAMPKQFVDLLGTESLFQQVLRRAMHKNFAAPLILTSSDYRFIAAQQIADISQQAKAILLEPEPKNTAPAILAAAHYCMQQDRNAMLLVLPSDHFIPDSHAFTSMVEQAERLADKGQIVTFGVVPDRPETGYGYIEEGEKGKVLAFHEKPDHGRAAEMLQSGRFLWNAGIFLGLADSFISGADSFVPEMNAQVKKAVDKAEKDLDFLRLDRENWAEITPLSVDYALMEKADNLSVVPFSGTWSDLGDWQAIKRAVSTQKTDSNRAGQDSDGNILKGKAVQTGTTNSLIWAEEGGPVVAVAGLDNIIAVAMADAVLIADTKKAQSVKDLIESLKDKDISQAQTHARDYRPWGWFESLVLAPFYQVKRLHVYACSSLSLQSHKFRSEHWVVTDGTATVQIEDEVFDLQANQSVYIEAGQKHRLSNKTDAPVTLIEVQTGSYLGEDDIIRYEDQYKRV